ncbi:DNA polymerase IV [Candidatus Uhrbacteria bacterium]|nr:DNA polymerase IV [Candidatus Uhrbacteria bacterium]
MTRAILHIDGDAFFASCEQARNPLLKGRPVITGKERGIASSMSYEAKRKGITRGMRLFEILRACPDAVILPSDYELYSLISQRFMTIVRRYTSVVEEYGIDECFADLTGMDKPLGLSYEEIGRRIQADLIRELDCSFSVGLAPTKVLAKVGSKWEKPNGFTMIEHHTIPRFLAELPVESVWGIGGQTASILQRHGIFTALDFMNAREGWVRDTLAKPFVEIWHELNGKAVLAIECEERKPQVSIQKVKTFTPPSDKREYIFSQLSRNIENACIRARRHGLAAREVTFFLRTQDFRHFGVRAQFSKATAFPNKITHVLEGMFGELFHARNLYRATGVVLSKLTDEASAQLDLFGDHVGIEKMTRLYNSVDTLDHKFGKHTVFVGSSFATQTTPQFVGARADRPWREGHLLQGETLRQHVGIPIFFPA